MAFFSDHPGLREGFGEMVRKVPPTAGAVPPTSTALIRRRALAKDLLPSSYAKGIGFGEVVEKVHTSSKSGVKACPRGAVGCRIRGIGVFHQGGGRQNPERRRGRNLGVLAPPRRLG
jgi:hypothetical protein